MSPLSSGAPFSEVLGVLDRLDQQAAADPKAAQRTLVDTTHTICQEQQLPYSLIAIKQAAAAQLAGQPLPKPQLTAPHIHWGWRRPQKAPEYNALPSRMERFLRWMGESKATLEGNLLLSFGVAGMTFTLEALPLPALAHFLIFPMSFVGTFVVWMLGEKIARALVKRHYDYQKEATVNDFNLRTWARIPYCRHYVQACLASPIPYLMEGDVLQLERRAEQFKQDEEIRRTAEAQARHQAMRSDRVDQLRKLFSD